MVGIGNRGDSSVLGSGGHQQKSAQQKNICCQFENFEIEGKKLRKRTFIERPLSKTVIEVNFNIGIITLVHILV